MRRSEYRTTNFSIIEYFAKNDFKPLFLKDLITQLLKDYKLNPKKYVLAHENTPFKSLTNFKLSIQSSIKRNKVFFQGPGAGQISVNLKKAKHYLNTMYGKYINNSKDVKTPIKMFSERKKINHAPPIPVINLTTIQTEENEKEEEKENETIIIEQSSEQILENINIKITDNKDKDNKANNSDYTNDITTNNATKENLDDNTTKNIYNINNYFEKVETDINDEEIMKNKEEKNNSNNKTNNFNSNMDNNNDIWNKEETNDIMLKKLKNIYFILSFKKEFLYKLLIYSIEKSEGNKVINTNPNEKEKIWKIINYLKILYEKKNSYEKLFFQIQNLQEEILYIIKLMKQHIKSIIWEINDKSYTYQSYLKLKDIIDKYESIFNNICETIEQKLNDIINIEYISIEIKNNLQNCLNDNNDDKFFYENKFNDLIRAILESDINMNNWSKHNNLDIINIWMALKKMKFEKKLIINEMVKIDNDIGNIVIN